MVMSTEKTPGQSTISNNGSGATLSIRNAKSVSKKSKPVINVRPVNMFVFIALSSFTLSFFSFLFLCGVSFLLFHTRFLRFSFHSFLAALWIMVVWATGFVSLTFYFYVQQIFASFFVTYIFSLMIWVLFFVFGFTDDFYWCCLGVFICRLALYDFLWLSLH